MKKISIIELLKESTEKPIDEGTAKDLLLGFKGGAGELKTAKPGVFAAFNDVLSFAKNDKNQIKGLTAKSPNSYVNITNVDDLIYALRDARGMSEEAMALFHQGLLKAKSTPQEIVSSIAKEVIQSEKFIKTYGGLTPKQMENALRERRYSEPAIQSLMAEAKTNKTFKAARAKGIAQRKAAKTKSGGTKNLNPKTNGGNVPPAQKKTLSERYKELIAGIKDKNWNWKKTLAWGAGLGLTGAAIWWWLFENNAVVPDDIPENEPVDGGGEWAVCIQELIASKEGVVGSDANGVVNVTVKTAEYPDGVQFYTNGRVLNVKTGAMGTWKCIDGKPTVQAESKRISLKGLLNEQGSEVSDQQMDAYVDDAVDDLDGYVAEYNLTSLKNILTALKGKTYQGEDAIKKFLEFYKEDEGVDFVTDVKSVGVANLSVMAKNMKPQIIALATGASANSAPKPTTPGGKLGLSHIQITWDASEKTGGDGKVGGNPKPKKSSVNYHDCSSKDFPFEFGCIAPKIAEIQGCIGVKPQKGYFGPKTLSALKNLEYIKGESVITKEMYDKIKTLPGCGQPVKTDDKKVTAPAPEEKPQPQMPTNGENPDAAGLKKPEVAPEKTPAPATPEETGQDIYNRLQRQGFFRGRKIGENDRVPYKGGELPGGDVEKLDQFFGDNGYKRFRPAQDGKRYGEKYVWRKP